MAFISCGKVEQPSREGSSKRVAEKEKLNGVRISRELCHVLLVHKLISWGPSMLHVCSDMFFKFHCIFQGKRDR